MSTPRSVPRKSDTDPSDNAQPNPSSPPYAPAPTYASFSPANLSSAATSSAAKRRSTILVHQKSPLLLATPPQITRALAYSHPFLLPLNKLAGLLSWTTGDPWESFLLLALFWAVVLYGDFLVRFAGPIVVAMGLIAGMYGRRYSPLSSSGWTEHPSMATSDPSTKDKKSGSATSAAQARARSETTSTRHQKTLDEIVDTIKVLTTRCNILMEPLLEMTDFLSTQRTATSATTRPALTTLFVRLLAITPIWIALTLPPLRIITTKRVALLFGTLVLTWHSRVCRVSRSLLWRSASVRRLARFATGLQFEAPVKASAVAVNGSDALRTKLQANNTKRPGASALTAALKRGGSGIGKDSGVRFTFILYENQRRWLGLGWTNSLFAYERAAWTDEQNNTVPPKDQFELPEVEDAPAKWRWAEGSKWRVDGVPDLDEYDTEAAKNGWIFYDNKWQNGRRGQDGWGRWTRRRKWYRDAELVEISAADATPEGSPTPSASPQPPALPPRRSMQTSGSDSEDMGEDDYSTEGAKGGDGASGLSTSNPERSAAVDTSGQDPKDAADNTSVNSGASSGRSRWRWSAGVPTLRRRGTVGSNASKGAGSVGGVGGGGGPDAASPSSPSSAVNEEELPGFGNLAPELELEIHDYRKGQGRWGIGDEAEMGLE